MLMFGTALNTKCSWSWWKCPDMSGVVLEILKVLIWWWCYMKIQGIPKVVWEPWMYVEVFQSRPMWWTNGPTEEHVGCRRYVFWVYKSKDQKKSALSWDALWAPQRRRQGKTIMAKPLAIMHGQRLPPPKWNPECSASATGCSICSVWRKCYRRSSVLTAVRSPPFSMDQNNCRA